KDTPTNAMLHRNHVHWGHCYAQALDRSLPSKLAWPGQTPKPVPIESTWEEPVAETLRHPWKPEVNGQKPTVSINRAKDRWHDGLNMFAGASVAGDSAYDPARPEVFRFYNYDGRDFMSPGDNPNKIIPNGRLSSLS